MMKTNFSTVYDYVILHGTHKQEEAESIKTDEGKTVYPLKTRVNSAYFYSEEYDDRNGIRFKKIYLDRDEVFALAEKFREIEATPVPNGEPDHDDDLPF